MANMNVTYEEMAAQANKLINAKNDIETQLGRLESEVQQLVSGGFVTDKASGQFGSSYEQFHKGATQCIGGLEGMSQFLTKAVSALQDVDTQLAAAMKQ